MVARVVSITLATISGLVFLFFSFSGFHTWMQEYSDPSIISVLVLGGLHSLVLFPGIAPLLFSIYFFLYLKKPIYNLVGVVAIIPVVFFHVIVTIITSHSSIYAAVGIGMVELLVIIATILLFQRHFVTLRK